MEKERQVNGVEPEKSEDDIQREQLGPLSLSQTY